MSEGQPRVGFIGIGTMGWPMAANILHGGYALLVSDQSPEQRDRFVNEFPEACAVDNPQALSECDFIVCMLPNGHIVREAICESGLLEKMLPGTVIIDMSSSEPMGTREMGKVLAEKNVTLVDAPVSGAKVRAVDGTLTIMIGGDDADAIEKAGPVLQTMGKQLFECGGLGCGHAAKALNNYIAATAYAATAESCLIAERFGLDRHTLMDILNVSTGKSFISEVVMKDHVIDGKFATGFQLGLLTKDVRIAAGLGEAVGLDAPVSRLVRERWENANAELGETADHSEAILSWDRSLP